MCDDTQNLNETESETFFRYQILPIPNPILFPIPNIFNTESYTFFDTKKFRYRIQNHLKNWKVSKPRSCETKTSPQIPKIWTKPYPCIISVSFGTVLHSKSWEFYFLRLSVCDDTQNLNETESETFFDTKFFRYRIRNHQKNGKVSKPRSFETETSHSALTTIGHHWSTQIRSAS